MAAMSLIQLLTNQLLTKLSLYENPVLALPVDESQPYIFFSFVYMYLIVCVIVIVIFV